MKSLSLQVNSIQKNFKNKCVLSDVTLTVSCGECVGIVGINGSGKTTLFNIIFGETKPDKGDIYIQNENTNTPLLNNKKLIKKHIGYVPQNNALIEDLSTLDNLRLWYCDSSLDMHKELNDGILHELGIDSFLHTKVSKLSGGMQKRLSIATTLASDPDFLILDEPSAALDIVAKNIIRNYLCSFKSKGGILIATHDEDELAICDRVLVLKNGYLEEIPPTIRGSKLIEKIL